MTDIFVFGWSVREEAVAGIGLLIAAVAAASSLTAGLLAYRARIRSNQAAADRIEVKFPNGHVVSVSESMSAAEIAGNLQAIHAKLAPFEDAARLGAAYADSHFDA